MNKADYLQYLLVWLLLAAIPVSRMVMMPQKSVGLVVGYTFQLWMYYWLGAALHALPWSDLPDDGFVFVGFKESVTGFFGLILGSAAGPTLARLFPVSPDPPGAGAHKMALRYVMWGILIAFVFRPILTKIPSSTALLSAGQQFALAGVCIGSWYAWRRGDKRTFVMMLLPVLLMPVGTMLGQGFLGFGVLAVAAVVFFVGQFYRPRWALVLGFIIIGYAGLSFYAAYMRDRILLRSAVWTDQDFSTRWGRLQQTLTSVEPFNLWNPRHLESVDGRLNQNGLMGAAVVNLTANQDYANGETLWMAVLAMVPRVLWPEKPVTAGSGDLVTRFTGITFAEGTSVGIGSVLELYANFGSTGEFFGFVVLGLIVGLADARAAIYLHSGQWHRFAVWFASGLALLQVGGSMVEVSSSVLGCIVLGAILKATLPASVRQRDPAPNLLPTRAANQI